MPIVSSLILPHGAMIFDGGEGCTAASADRISALPKSLKEDVRTLFRASREAADIVKSTKPDVIFLNTPHGIGLSNAHCVYLNSRAKGNAEWNSQWMEYGVEVSLDSELAASFMDHLKKDDIPVEGMRAFTVCEAPLRWGEVIPLWFFRDLTTSGVKVVIFSNPLAASKKDLPLSDVAKVGRSIATFLNGLNERVLYVVSGDLAHSHETDCTVPLYLPDPRWNMPTSDKALPFDLFIENWTKCASKDVSLTCGPAKTKERSLSTFDADSSQHAQYWLSKGMEVKGQVLSCGIYGFGLLHGILSAEVESRRATYESHLLCRLAPTYYGMIVAAFVKKI